MDFHYKYKKYKLKYNSLKTVDKNIRDIDYFLYVFASVHGNKNYVYHIPNIPKYAKSSLLNDSDHITKKINKFLEEINTRNITNITHVFILVSLLYVIKKNNNSAINTLPVTTFCKKFFGTYDENNLNSDYKTHMSYIISSYEKNKEDLCMEECKKTCDNRWWHIFFKNKKCYSERCVSNKYNNYMNDQNKSFEHDKDLLSDNQIKTMEKTINSICYKYDNFYENMKESMNNIEGIKLFLEKY